MLLKLSFHLTAPPLLLLLAAPSMASVDSCDDLISSLESAKAAPDISPTTKSQIDEWLGASRSAKAKDNVAVCEAASKMPMQSAPSVPG